MNNKMTALILGLLSSTTLFCAEALPAASVPFYQSAQSVLAQSKQQFVAHTAQVGAYSKQMCIDSYHTMITRLEDAQKVVIAALPSQELIAQKLELARQVALKTAQQVTAQAYAAKTTCKEFAINNPKTSATAFGALVGLALVAMSPKFKDANTSKWEKVKQALFAATLCGLYGCLFVAAHQSNNA